MLEFDVGGHAVDLDPLSIPGRMRKAILSQQDRKSVV